MENKAETLQKLYNIRAGLSAVSVQRDEIERRENEISETKKKINENYNAYVAKRQSLEKEIDEYKGWIENVPQEIMSYEQELAEKNNAKDLKAHIKRWKKKTFQKRGIRICSPLKLKKEYNYYFEEELPKNIRWRKEWLSEWSHLEEKKQRLVSTHKNETVALQNRINLLQESKAPIVAYTNGMYDVVVKEYGSFLSVSDWQNLDYIIYLFETGRADTIKESLILLDEMKRHDMLMKAMGHIASTIRAGFGELNSTMMRGFSMMSSQLESLSSQMDSIRSAQQNNNALLGDLGKKMDVYSALCTKANTTSETMMKDVDYIKSRLSR